MKTRFLRNYLAYAPLPLAIERAHECEIFATKPFSPPILDVGCGDGIFARVLFDELIDLGVDVDARELEAARRAAAHRELIRCDAKTIPRPDRSFRTVFSNSVLEHIPHIEDVLREIRRVIADDGVLYVTVPSDFFDRYSVVYQLLAALRLRGLAERWRRFFNSFWRHYHYHDRAGWTELFARTGFDVFDFQEYATKLVCVLDDALAPFAIGSFVTKKLFNRWVLWPGVRRIFCAPIASALLGSFVRFRPDTQRGGILFFALRPAR